MRRVPCLHLLLFMLPTATGCDKKADANAESIAYLTQRINDLEAELETLRTEPEGGDDDGCACDLPESLAALGAYVEVDPARHAIVFTGANVYVQNGLGATNGNPSDPKHDDEAVANGLGNLIVGYDEDAGPYDYPESEKTGSHNLVVGRFHSYTSVGGLVGGSRNYLVGPFAGILGGRVNTAAGGQSTVSGGSQNTAAGDDSTVAGGEFNAAAVDESMVVGGSNNVANAEASLVVGGADNVANGAFSVVLGGQGNASTEELEVRVDGLP